jgi:hypothetical protein
VLSLIGKVHAQKCGSAWRRKGPKVDDCVSIRIHEGTELDSGMDLRRNKGNFLTALEDERCNEMTASCHWEDFRSNENSDSESTATLLGNGVILGEPAGTQLLAQLLRCMLSTPSHDISVMAKAGTTDRFLSATSPMPSNEVDNANRLLDNLAEQVAALSYHLLRTRWIKRRYYKQRGHSQSSSSPAAMRQLCTRHIPRKVQNHCGVQKVELIGKELLHRPDLARCSQS